MGAGGVNVSRVHPCAPGLLQHSLGGGQRNAGGLSSALSREVQLLSVEGSGNVSAEQLLCDQGVFEKCSRLEI